MHFSASTFFLVGIMAQNVVCQTPPGTSPATYSSLSVTYGTTKLTPGIKLPTAQASTIPAFSHISTSPNQTYSLLLVDLSINAAQINTSLLTPGVQVPLAPGISTGRTTFLHFWQPGVTFASNGSLVNTTKPIAYYEAPAPPVGDGPHTYALYLFEQGAGFAPPPPGNPFSTALVNEKKGLNRISFDVNHLASEKGIGPLIAANYFVLQNSTAAKSSGAAAATATGGASGSGTGSATASTSPISFTGGASATRISLTGTVVTFFAIGAALLFMV